MSEDEKRPPNPMPIDGAYRQARIPKYVRPATPNDEESYWAEEEQRFYEEKQAQENAKAEAEAKEAAVDEMYEWFHTHFEDPSNETPRAEGEFIYVWGGPFDASEQVWEVFESEYKEEWIEEAVDLIQADGTFDWAPKSTGDYYEHPDDDQYSADAGGIDIITNGINELRNRLQELPTRPDAIGHNQPPEDIGLPPYNEEDKQQIEAILLETETELDKDASDASKLQILGKRLMDFGTRALRYGAQKADLAVDESIKTGIKAVAGAGLFYAFGEQAISIAESIIRFARAFL